MKGQNNLLETALKYLNLGWSVIPLKRNKRPLISEWATYQKRLPSEQEVKEWWQEWPNANIGIVTGAISGLVVLDADSGKATQHIQQRGMPPTPQTSTGKGTHFYLKHPGRNVPNKVNREIGLDVRGDGGYVMAPPSIHPNGNRYEWAPYLNPWDADVEDMHPWMIEYCDQKSSRPEGGKDATGWQNEALKGVGKGERNQTAARLAGRYIDKDMADEEVVRILLNWNQKNNPPLPKDEITRTVESVRATHERNHGIEPKSEPDTPNGNGKDKKKRETHADVLIRIGLGPNIRLFHIKGGRAFASVKHEGGRAIWLLSSRNFKEFLTARFFSEKGSAPGKDALRQALPVLEGKAKFGGELIKLSNRVAWHDGAIHYDVADKMGRIVKVTPGNWEILGEHIDEDLPILFRRYDHQEPQRLPDCYSPDLELLMKYLHLSDDNQKFLLLVYIISCFVPEIPHPIMVIHGPQGAAKSTTTKIVRKLIDPSVNDLQTLTRRVEQTVHALAQNWFCAFDNISHIDEETSDALCRASTGGTLTKRQLYTDEDMITFELQTCVSLNGINVAVNKADLMDRALLFEASRIPESERKEVKQLLEEFDRDRPRILAGIFSALAKAMKIEPDLKSKRLPRMADFARWGRAISEALGVGDEKFLSVYQENIAQQHEEIVSSTPVGIALMVFMNDKSRWEGSVSVLLGKLEELCESLGIDRRSRFWPGAPHILTRRLKELEATLAGVGMTIDLKRSSKGSIITITKSDDTKEKIASHATVRDYYDSREGDTSVATSIPRESALSNESTLSVGHQNKEKEGYVNDPPKCHGSYTSVTSVTPDPTKPCQGSLSAERPTPETCDGCPHFKLDPHWPRCEQVKGNTNVAHLDRCPLSETSRRRSNVIGEAV